MNVSSEFNARTKISSVECLFIGNYGSSGMQEFSSMARAFNICLAISREVSNNADDTAFDKVQLRSVWPDKM